MSFKALIIAITISMSSSVFAQFFPAKAHVTVLPGQVTVQVYNPFYEPIICSGQVFGQTAYGVVHNAFFTEQFLPAGDFRHAFVNATGFNPFVTGWANIHCRFARFW